MRLAPEEACPGTPASAHPWQGSQRPEVAQACLAAGAVGLAQRALPSLHSQAASCPRHTRQRG